MPGGDGNPCSAAPEAPPGTTLAEEELTRAGRRSPGSLLSLRVVSVPGPHSTSSTFGTDANRRRREVHDAAEQRVVLRANLCAEQGIGVTGPPDDINDARLPHAVSDPTMVARRGIRPLIWI